MLAELEARLEDYKQKLEQVIANHNYVAGAYAELKAIYDLYVKFHGIIPEVVAALPVVDKAADAVIDIVHDVMHPQ